MSRAHLPGSSSSSPAGGGAKTALRDQLLTARNRLSPLELGEAARAIAAHLLAETDVRRAATVAAYVSVGSEPGTTLLLESLLEAGRRVLLPVLLPDGDLDWALHPGGSGPGAGAGAFGGLVRGRFGLLEPAGRRLGVDAVAGADVVLVPGLACSTSSAQPGLRLGRGGGSYDRALARVAAVAVPTFTCVLLHDGELLGPRQTVPAEPHDRPVSAAVTPSGGVVRFSG